MCGLVKQNCSQTWHRSDCLRWTVFFVWCPEIYTWPYSVCRPLNVCITTNTWLQVRLNPQLSNICWILASTHFEFLAKCKIPKIFSIVTVLGTFVLSILILYCIGLKAKLDFDLLLMKQYLMRGVKVNSSTVLFPLCLQENGFSLNFIGTLMPRLMV